MKSKILFWITLVLTALLMFILTLTDHQITQGDHSKGMISFELAYSLKKSEEIVKFYNENEVTQQVIWSLKLDYIFLLAYGSFFVLSVLLLARNLKDGFLKKIATWIIILFILASLLDAVENYALLQILELEPTQFRVSQAFICASIKFGFIGLGALYLLIGSIARINQNKS